MKTLLKYATEKQGQGCIRCGRQRRIRLEFHHIIPIEGLEKQENPSILLCKDCHTKLHRFYYKTLKEYVLKTIGTAFFIDLVKEFVGEEHFLELQAQ